MKKTISFFAALIMLFTFCLSAGASTLVSNKTVQERETYSDNNFFELDAAFANHGVCNFMDGLVLQDGSFVNNGTVTLAFNTDNYDTFHVAGAGTFTKEEYEQRGQASITTPNASADCDVYAKYQDGSTVPVVYKVDVEWGAMEFTYEKNGKKVWDAEEHIYADETTETWTANGNTITVTNHSNTDVYAALTYTGEEGYEGISGGFQETSGSDNDSVLELPTAEGTTVDSAPSASAVFLLEGALANDKTTLTKIGQITVALQ